MYTLARKILCQKEKKTSFFKSLFCEAMSKPELVVDGKMGKRYYCDFCDRSFADSGVNRKNHFKGSVHQRLRKQHYDSFKDAASILKDEELKLPCHRFQSGTCDYGDNCKFSHMTLDRKRQLEDMGTCDYGDNCKFSHMTLDRKRQLEDMAERDKVKAAEKARLEAIEPTLEEWLEKRRKRQKTEEGGVVALVEEVHYELPPFLANIPNLPPSLMPPTAEELRNKPVFEWG